MNVLKILLAVFAVIVLTACGAPGPIMPNDRSPAERSASTTQAAPSAYRVARGDTLYSIAFRYGLDWRELARINMIAPPYTIRVGQNLQLRSQSVASTSDRPVQAQDNLPGQTGTIGTQPRRVESRTLATEPATGPTTDQASAQTEDSTTPEPSATNEPESQAEPPPLVVAAPADTPSAPPASTPNPTPGTATAADIQTRGNGRSVAGTTWYWPTEGRLARRFNANDTRKGIHIAGEQGQTVRATADGEVVYSGNGLIGYGELIIIKHSDSMLSAYAHNRLRQVEQGDRVRAGQQIASMGEFEPNRPLLHFEIRRNGQPDDPLKYLPSR